MSRRRWGKSERGAVIVEVALVIPVVLLLILALCDFALAELSDSAGSNAAREGARVGILYYDGAAGSTASSPPPTSPNFTKIVNAVSAKLGGNVKGTPVVTVRCLNPDSTPRLGSGSCSTSGTSTVRAGRDFIEVTVLWTRKGGFTGFVGSTTRSDKSIMRIVGTPPTGGVPPSCAITASSATPSTVTQASGTIQDVVFDVTVNSRLACLGVTLDFPAATGVPQQSMIETSSGGVSFQYTLPSGTGTWSAGAQPITAKAGGGLATQTITLTVNNPASCSISAASPVTAQQWGGNLTSATTFTVSISSLATCGTPTITFPASTGIGTQTMTLVSGTNYSYTVSASDGTWSAQTYPVTVDGDGGASTNIGFVVSDGCLSAVSPANAAIVLEPSGQGYKVKTSVTFTVTRLTTSCGVPTITITPGASGNGANSLVSPQAMTCPAGDPLKCSFVLAANTGGWDLTTPRTVTMEAGSSSRTAPATVSL